MNRLISPFLRNPRRTLNLHVIKRNSGDYWAYRELNYDPNRPAQKVAAEFLAGMMWWWIGWNMMTDWRHLIGEFIWPQRSEWTDEELGIPKDFNYPFPKQQ